MSDLIDRQKCIENACGWCSASHNEMAIVVRTPQLLEQCKKRCTIVKLLYDAPAVDAVQVVRCKDCKHLRTCIPMSNKKYHFCNLDGQLITGENGFCLHGEKQQEA